MSLFDTKIKDKEIATSYKPEKPKASKAYRNVRSISRKLMKKQVATEIMQDIGGVPEKDYSVDVITNGQSNAGGFYEVIRDEWKTVDCLCVSTWIINRHYIEMLIDDVDKGILKQLVFIISNRMSQLTHHIPHFNYMKESFSKMENVSLRVCNSHSKTYSMTNGTDHVTVDGSGNWSDNPRIENYTITNSKEQFDFRKEWMLELCNAK